MKVQPLGNRVAVQRIDPDVQETEGGIILPETAQDTPNRARVRAVGSGRDEDSDGVIADLSEDDVVLIDEFSGSEIEVNGEEYVFVDLDQILAKVE